MQDNNEGGTIEEAAMFDQKSAEEPAKPEPSKDPKPVSTLIAVDQEKQIIVARDQSELWRMVQMFMKGTAFPKTINTPEKAIAAWQVAASLNLPPMVVMQNLAFIHGAVSMWGQLPKALAERTGQLEDCKIILFDQQQKVISLENKNLQDPVWGAAVQIRRTKRSMNEYYFTEPEAQKAGLLGKDGPWQTYRKIMYVRRALGHGCKFDFADALMGVPVAEYDHNIAPDLAAIEKWKDVTPVSHRDELEAQLAKRANTYKESSGAKTRTVQEDARVDLETPQQEEGIRSVDRDSEEASP